MLAVIDFRVALVSILCLSGGLGLGWLTWWFWKSAQPESPALAALEVMSERRWEQADEPERARILDAARIDPAGVAPMARRERGRGVDDRRGPVDEEFLDEWTDSGPIDPLLR